MGCVYTDVSCNDHDECTNDYCDHSEGCIHWDVICEDNNLCTRDLCCQDNGCYYAPICCDDNNACTVDSCDPYLGCLNVKISCDDGDECTIDRCHCDEGCQHFPVDPMDNEACGSWYEPTCSNEQDCEDGNACTVNSCREGSCHTVAIDCNDHDICTIDSCNPIEGCVYKKVAGPCNTRTHELQTHEDEEEIENTTEGKLEVSETGEKSVNLSVGAIAGIVVGGVVVLGVAVFIGIKVIFYNNQPTNQDGYNAM